MNKKLEDALNAQINEELYSAYIYMAMAADAESQGFLGVAQWFKVQTKEEIDHALGLYNYINERGGRAVLEAIAKPPVEYKTPLNMFKEALKHEQHITGKINDLVTLAREEKDYATESFLKWYVDEQVEEEANAMENVDKFKMIGDDKQVLYMLDKELSARVYAPASILAAEAK